MKIHAWLRLLYKLQNIVFYTKIEVKSVSHLDCKLFLPDDGGRRSGDVSDLVYMLLCFDSVFA